MKIRPLGTELFNAGRQTGRREEANSAFRNFANALRKWKN